MVINPMLPFLKKTSDDTSGKSDLPQELVHINQEMYKKSVELSERNKTLLLLRKIDEIILSSVTDHHEIARRVTQLLVTETDFQIAAIFEYDESKEVLKRLSLYETESMYSKNFKNDFERYYLTELSLSEKDNIIPQAIINKTATSSNTLQNSFVSKEGSTKLISLKDFNGVKSVHAYPFIVRDQLTGVIAVALTDEEQNISEYTKDLLARLAQVIGIAIDNASLYNNLQDANEKLKVLDKLKDEFVYLASHELRTPMTAIKSYLWMTLQGDAGILNDTQKLYLDRAYSSVERLIKLVNDMLNISRIESGRITVELQKVDLYKITQEIVGEIQPRATELGVHVIVNSAAGLPEVLADADKIKEVLFNLIGNSLKFTPKNGNISISFFQNNDMIETSISDTGAGISKENIDKLFQKFSMLPDSYANNKSASGSGLGLYISRSIIELHKGKIWANSEGLGKGAQFCFSLKVFKGEDLSKDSEISNNDSENKVGIVHTKL
ncbi:MAG TPA: GAF domain-containing sensor histidine kinase [Candidatus Limnocylindrales bacterium]|nr:GAF domain-containing sensor histidine kinase [Candidatus Limnocylindrales bacterium]